MLILVHRKMNVLYVRLVSSKFINRLQSYGKSPITSGSPLVCHLQKKHMTANKPLCMTSIDLEEAFDQVPRDVI